MAPRIHLGLLVGLLWVASLGTCFNLETREAQVFKFPGEKLPHDREPYFGFAVALQKHHANESAWLVVGSPRANSSTFEPNIKEPGAVFKCNLKDRVCEELKVDKVYGNGDWRRYSYVNYKNIKDGGWVGGALDTQPTYESGRQATVVCSPQWSRSKYSKDVPDRMDGVCYWLNDSLPVTSAHKMMPLLKKYKKFHGQVGFSVHLTSNPDEMIMGAPGYDYWTGTVVRAKDPHNFGSSSRRRGSRVADEDFFSNFFVPKPWYTSETEYFDLMGYAVTSGKYLSSTELLYGSGAPRGDNANGKVIIFSFPELDYMSLDVRQEMVGQQLGANFGSSLTSLDINGDGLSDLVVGAPMFMQDKRPDVGEVVVYLSSKINGLLQKASTTYHGSNVINARFGTTLASLGDLNKDNYEDFAVGAPFEEDGAVYIILGSRGELPMTHSQRLAAKDFSSGFRGFGISLSRGIDIDGNTYPDLAVGSFLSGHAVVVRSRPVIRLTSTLTTSPPTIQLDDQEFQIHVCFQFSGKEFVSHVDITGNLTLDPVFNRASFTNGNGLMKLAEELNHGDTNCQSYNASVVNLHQYPHDAIEILLESELAESVTESIIGQPVADPAYTSRVVSRVSIATGCNLLRNKTCLTDMNIKADFLKYKTGERLVIGDDVRPKFKVSVMNTGEPAFLATMTAEVEPPLSLLLPTSKSCLFSEGGQGQTSLVCQLTNPIFNTTEDTVEIEIDTSHLRTSLSSVKIKVAVKAQGIEDTPKDTELILKLDLESEAMLFLYGSNSEEQVRYNLDKQGNKTKTVRHSFTLVKGGPTPLERVLLNINIPVKFPGGEAFVAIFKPRANFMDQPVKCLLTGANFTVDLSEVKDTVLEIMDSETPTYTMRTKRSVSSESGRTMMADGSLNLNCTEGKVECAHLTCQLDYWPSDTSTATIEVQLGFNFSVLAGHLSTKLGGLFKTSAQASIQILNPNLTLTGNRTASAVVVTHLQPESMHGAGVPWWVILLAVLGGVLLLALLAFGMYKAGFFKRKQLEELKFQKAKAKSTASAQGSANPAEVKDE